MEQLLTLLQGALEARGKVLVKLNVPGRAAARGHRGPALAAVADRVRALRRGRVRRRDGGAQVGDQRADPGAARTGGPPTSSSWPCPRSSTEPWSPSRTIWRGSVRTGHRPAGPPWSATWPSSTSRGGSVSSSTATGQRIDFHCTAITDGSRPHRRGDGGGLRGGRPAAWAASRPDRSARCPVYPTRGPPCPVRKTPGGRRRRAVSGPGRTGGTGGPGRAGPRRTVRTARPGGPPSGARAPRPGQGALPGEACAGAGRADGGRSDGAWPRVGWPRVGWPVVGWLGIGPLGIGPRGGVGGLHARGHRVTEPLAARRRRRPPRRRSRRAGHRDRVGGRSGRRALRARGRARLVRGARFECRTLLGVRARVGVGRLVGIAPGTGAGRRGPEPEPMARWPRVQTSPRRWAPRRPPPPWLCHRRLARVSDPPTAVSDPPTAVSDPPPPASPPAPPSAPETSAASTPVGAPHPDFWSPMPRPASGPPPTWRTPVTPRTPPPSEGD